MRRRRRLGRRSLRRWRRCCGGYNPNSLHAEGRAARAAVDDARETVARVLGASPREIVFTGGGSESDVLAIVGAARAAARHAGGTSSPSSPSTMPCCTPSTCSNATAGASRGCRSIRAGSSIRRAFAAALTPETTARERDARQQRDRRRPTRCGAGPRSPASAACCSTPTRSRRRAGSRSTSMRSASTCSRSRRTNSTGPKASARSTCGAARALEPLIVGGGQEHGLRAGTENVAGIAGLRRRARARRRRAARHRAARRGAARPARGRHRRRRSRTPSSTARARRGSPNNLSVAFAGVPSDALLIRLDLDGIAASAGSACAAGSLEPSHVAAALGLDERHRRGVIRFSLGRDTTEARHRRRVRALAGYCGEHGHAARRVAHFNCGKVTERGSSEHAEDRFLSSGFNWAIVLDIGVGVGVLLIGIGIFIVCSSLAEVFARLNGTLDEVDRQIGALSVPVRHDARPRRRDRRHGRCDGRAARRRRRYARRRGRHRRQHGQGRDRSGDARAGQRRRDAERITAGLRRLITGRRGTSTTPGGVESSGVTPSEVTPSGV